MKNKPLQIGRRQIVTGLSGIGAAIFLAGDTLAQSTFACLTTDQMTEGPYWVDEELNRSDIRVDPSNGTTKTGTPLTLQISVYEALANGCSPLPNAQIDIWHCDASGVYSDEAANNTVGQKFLRGFQTTDSTGTVNFTTIYPGWYSGRAVHIHVRVRTYSGTALTGQFVTQLFFDDSVTDTVLSAAPYNTRGTRDTRNANDMVHTGATHPDRSLVTLAKTSQGYAASINTITTLTTGSTPNTTPGTRYALPHVAYGGGWYTGLYLTNLTTASASSPLVLYGVDGTKLTVPELSGTAGSQQVSIAANSTAIVELPNSGDLTMAWLDLTLPSGVFGYAVLRQSIANQPDQETALSLNSEAGQNADLIYDDIAQTTAVAIANPGTSSIVVSAIAYKDDGSQIGSGTLSLAALNKSAFALSQLDGLASIAGTRGRVTFTAASGTFAILGVRFGATTFPALPVNYR